MGALLRAFVVLLLIVNRDPRSSPTKAQKPAEAAAHSRDAQELQAGDRAGWSRRGGGVANIEYTLPKAGHVRVIVFDAGGRELARPVNEWQRAGTHMTSFAFGPDSGPVFRYRVECDGRKRSGKITIAP